MLKRTSLFFALMGLLAVVALPGSSAHAQATRTWVSGVGDDANPCSRTAPCKTFAGAISKTAAAGMINCIDPGGFGAVTIVKAMAIDCGGTFGGIVVAGTNGIIVNAGASDKVMIRNIEISGTVSVPGLNGIRYIAGGELNVENVNIHTMTSGTPNGAGILAGTSATGVLTVRNVSFHAVQHGINLSATSGALVASVTNTRFNGIAVNGINAGQGAFVSVSDSGFPRSMALRSWPAPLPRRLMRGTT